MAHGEEKKIGYTVLEIPRMKIDGHLDDQPRDTGQVHFTGTQESFLSSKTGLPRARNLCARCTELDIKKIFLEKTWNVPWKACHEAWGRHTGQAEHFMFSLPITGRYGLELPA